MKKKILLIIITIGAGILFTFYFLNKENIYAKEEYIVYAFQVGAFKNYENAQEYSQNFESFIIKQEDNLYKVFVGIYNNIDIVNKMIVYFENNNINIYLKSLNVSKKFYNDLENYEKIILNTEDTNVYNKINESILNNYLESINYEKDI